MKKTKKVNKTTKSPRRSVNKVKFVKPLVLALGILLIAGGGIVYKFYPMSAVTKVTNDKIFCAGIDTLSGDSYVIKYSPNISKDQGHVRVFKANKIPPTPLTMTFHDVVATIEYQGVDGGASRANLRINANENLQVYRDCGAKPVCRLELVHHLTPAMLAQAKAELKDLEKEEAKIGNEVDRTILLGKKVKKRNASALLAIEQKIKVFNARLAELDPQIKMTKDLVNGQGTDMQTIDLKPDQTTSWCSDLAH